MKLGLALLCALFAVPAFSADQAVLSAVKKVYLLPMSHGFDQYLANQLTMQNVFQVVTDPKLADALITDQIGMKFERQFDELYPPPPEPEEPAEASADTTAGEKKAGDTGTGEAKTDEKKASKKKADEQEAQAPAAELLGDLQRPISTFSRGKGNLFLVDRASRAIIWSSRYVPKNSSSEALNKAAAEVVAELHESIGGQ